MIDILNIYAVAIYAGIKSRAAKSVKIALFCQRNDVSHKAQV